ncbi:MAG: hypothetical protein WKI04_14900 [Ferruginibacter sp.]
MNPEITTPSSPGTAINIIIGNDGSFERRQNDSLLFRGTYRLLEKKDCYGEINKFLFKTSDQQAGSGTTFTSK